jgi:ribosomal protein S18 acetylase RimI-like enzyme
MWFHLFRRARWPITGPGTGLGARPEVFGDRLSARQHSVWRVNLEWRAHRNLCDFTRFVARLQPAARLLDVAGAVAVRGPVDWPSQRFGIRADPELPAVAFADALQEFFFGDASRSAAVFLRAGADDDVAQVLAERGFGTYADSPEMVCEAPLDARPAPDGVRARLASTAADVAAYASIAAEAFRHLGFHHDATRATIDNPEVMLAGDVVVALAEVDGRAVAGACIVIVGDEPDGYVAWVSCRDEARGRGLGDVVTRLATNEAFARGAGIVSLEASPFGEHTYARMGYREICRYRTLVRF